MSFSSTCINCQKLHKKIYKKFNKNTNLFQTNKKYFRKTNFSTQKKKLSKSSQQ